ncbi:acyl carrier protein, partial [Methylophilaceae bacterium]|nr:acyl carrier protein [Methylophilaceae bacterium]
LNLNLKGKNFMDNSEILTKLQPVFQEVFDEDDLIVTPEMTADDIDEWDSLSNVRLMISIEVEFGIKVKASEVANLSHVELLVDLISKKLNQI